MAKVQSIAKSIGMIVILSLTGGIIISGLIASIRLTMGWSIPFWSTYEQLLIPFIHYTFVLASWSILYFCVHAEMAKQSEQRRAIAAEADALRAEIRQLRLQLEPHFLFNALNGIIEEVRSGSGAALPMMKDLAAYLRHSLAGIRNPVVQAEDEAIGLIAYLAIQKDRFGERLNSSVLVDPAAADRPIAHFLLQPLVENAVNHGDRSSLLEISVRITFQDTALIAEVENTGRLESNAPAPPHAGIGLANVRRRLEVHYPGRHHFALRQINPGAGGVDHVLATLVLEGEPCSAS
ncbi:histidine kinase [Xanthobacter sp. DSM 24535]|nr:histidine kinase [Aquabacter spiritensis]